MTARGVAAHRLGFEREPAAYGDPDGDQRLQEDVAAGLDVPPTMTRYLRVRTQFFDRAVVHALAAHIAQVVAVGAGYDGRSLRYAAPGVRWFELDHPATQADKRARLERLGVPSGHVTFAAADFAVDDVAAVLAGVGLDPRAPTLFTCEGVAGYLPAAALDALVVALRAAAGPGSRLVVEIPIEPEGEAEVARRAQVRSTVAGLGEPLLTSVPRARLVGWFADARWTVVRAIDPRGVDILESDLSTAFVVAEPA